MISWYELDNKQWIVTYQRNKYSAIETLGIFDSEEEALIFVDNFIEEWG